MDKNNTIVTIINNLRYFYNEFYNRLEVIGEHENQTKAHIACPKCHNTSFQINYGNYECIANCKCGHSMTVYDG